MRASQLLAVAQELVSGGRANYPGPWSRTAAVLGRLVIEGALGRFWHLRVPGLERCSTHAQLLCLGNYIRDRTLVRTIAAAWADLSRACHHHPYELGPTTDELDAWLAVADEFAAEVDRQIAAGTRKRGGR